MQSLIFGGRWRRCRPLWLFAIVGVVVLRGGALGAVTNLRCRVHSESLANLLIPLRLYSTLFSECPLKSLRGLADFDSTMRRFESSRPSQDLANQIRRFLNLPGFRSGGPRPARSEPVLPPGAAARKIVASLKIMASLACRDGPTSTHNRSSRDTMLAGLCCDPTSRCSKQRSPKMHIICTIEVRPCGP